MSMEDLLEEIRAMGAHAAAVVKVVDISFDRSFRSLCEANACGNYGQCWTCPPDAGDIDELIARAKTFDKALVYQTVSPLEDSYDYEGMMAAGRRTGELSQRIAQLTDGLPLKKRLHLGAGGCRVCPVCGKRTGEPCRHPERAMASLETYGVAVSRLAAVCGMKYTNGPNTVTYFGALLYTE